MILVSRSEQSSFVMSSAYWADSEERGGVGRREAFKLAASSRRVSLISILSLSKGIARTWAILSLSSVRDGMVWFSRTRESSKFVGIWTFSRADKEGIVISGMEKSALNRFCLSITGSVLVGWTYIDSLHGRPDEPVARSDIGLDAISNSIE
jgi:hypothetical protein